MNTIQSIDLLIPVFNEEECLSLFISRLSTVLENMHMSYNVIFVDDGSTDHSLSIIKDACENNPQLGYISLSRNFGKEAAMSAGIDNSRAEALVIIDADLQDPPELIPDLLNLLEQKDADVVFAKRKKRHGESFIKKAFARIFYRIFNKLSRFDFPEDTGDFRILKRRVVRALQQIEENNRFMKGLFAWVGFQQIEFLYDRDSRFRGKSKFNFIKLLSFALDGITAFTTIPLKFASYVGSSFALLAILFGTYFLLKSSILGDPVPGFPTLIVALSFFSGVQLMFLGVLGEYLARTNIEAKKRPLYIVRESRLSSEGYGKHTANQQQPE